MPGSDVVAVGEAVSQTICFVSRPADLLLQPAELRLRLRGDDSPTGAICQYEVDDPARRMIDRNFKFGAPSPVEAAQHGFDHRGLEPVMQTGAGTGEVPDAQVGSKRHAHRSENLEAWSGATGLDPRDVRPVNTDDIREFGNGHARIQTESA